MQCAHCRPCAASPVPAVEVAGEAGWEGRGCAEGGGGLASHSGSEGDRRPGGGPVVGRGPRAEGTSGS